MKLKNQAFFTVGLFCCFASCQPEREQPKEARVLSPEQKEEFIAEANDATKVLATALSSQLKSALQSGGPEKALQVCQAAAQPLTASTNADLNELTISRVALRYRNSQNAPDAQDQELMKLWEKLLREGEPLPSHQLVESGDLTATVYKPIVTQALCLKCHGDASMFSAELESELSRFYPDDQAVGFKEGELRGVFKISQKLTTD